MTLIFLGSLPYLADDFDKDLKFYLALFGAILLGVSRALVNSVMTLIGYVWFGEKERIISTVIVSTSGTLGPVIAIGITPLLVTDKEGIPWMNLVWFVLAATSFMLALWKIRTDAPPTPPTQSAALGYRLNLSWLASLKKLATFQFIFICFINSILISIVGTLMTKTEQILCANGYTDQFAGLVMSSSLLSGVLAAMPIGILINKIGKPVLMAKVFMFFGCSFWVGLSLSYLHYDNQATILTLAILAGISGIGPYSHTLELVANLSYPVDPSITTGLLYVGYGTIGTAMFSLEHYFSNPLSEEAMLHQKCSSTDDLNHEVAKDYANYLYFLAGSSIASGSAYILGFWPQLKRTKADRLETIPENCTAQN